jgi:hypothetical protein
MTTVTIEPDSTVIDKFDYDFGQQTLAVAFTNGNLVTYYEFPSDEFVTLTEELVDGGSAGQYYNSYIKGAYKTTPKADPKFGDKVEISVGGLKIPGTVSGFRDGQTAVTVYFNKDRVELA